MHACNLQKKPLAIIDIAASEADSVWTSSLSSNFALDTKGTMNVGEILSAHIFPYFREPGNIMQTCWKNGILVSGRPRRPQNQRLVERVHQTLLKNMAAEISTSWMKTLPWSEWLPRIVCKVCLVNLYDSMQLYTCANMQWTLKCLHINTHTAVWFDLRMQLWKQATSCASFLFCHSYWEDAWIVLMLSLHLDECCNCS